MSERARVLHREGDERYQAGAFEAALAAYRGALAETPGSIALHFNIGNALRHLRRPAEAIEAYDAALALAPTFAMGHHNRATCLMQLGDLAAGFREYEWRKASPGFADDPRYKLERPWRGENLEGKRLYIFPELFQGDLMQFGRYALLAERAGAMVTLGAPAAMIPLLETMSATLTVVPDNAPPPAYDYQAALMTLPALFGTNLQTVPAWPRYFRCETARADRLRERIGPQGFKVGLAWQGSALASQRSFPLAIAATALAKAPNTRLVSLQKHNGLEQLEALPTGLVETLGDDFDPGPTAFLDTAAAMTCCDLFVTPDTSVAHLAGALGVPTWLALPYVGDWRWLWDQAETPWYPSVRIFRQQSPDDWAGVFQEMAHALTVTEGVTGSIPVASTIPSASNSMI